MYDVGKWRACTRNVMWISMCGPFFFSRGGALCMLMVHCSARG